MSLRSVKSTVPIEDELENLYNEVAALQRAVESKTTANVILREELKECQRERDKFRTMAETNIVPPKITSSQVASVHHIPNQSAMLSGGCEGGTLAQLLSQSKEENKQLRLETTQLRCRLHDAQRDLKVLRDERHHHSDYAKIHLSASTSSQLAQQERENLIVQLEEFSVQCHALESDVRCLLEEREELIREREDIRHKLSRLNHVLNKMLSWGSHNGPQTAYHPHVNLDSLIVENRYLQQRLNQLKEEKSLALTNASKYKAALEKCRSSPGSLKLGSGEKLIVTPKQVSEFLKQHQGEIGEEGEADLKSLCIALVDALNQKSQAAKTQRAANKMLMERLVDLEKRMVGSVSSESAPNPIEVNLASESLMEGYSSSSNAMLPFSQVLTESTKLIQTASEKMSEEIKNDPSEYLVKETTYKVKENIQELKNHRESSSELEGEVEEVVPIEMLDSYISSIKRKQRVKMEKRIEEAPVVLEEPSRSASLIKETPLESTSSNSPEDFDIQLSDYDSDNSNLDVTLQDWQSDFDKGRGKANFSPRKKNCKDVHKSKYENL